jgi:hypothetical protein
MTSDKLSRMKMRRHQELEIAINENIGLEGLNLVLQYVEAMYELKKEELVDAGDDIIRGEAKAYRALIHKLKPRNLQPTERVDYQEM